MSSDLLPPAFPQEVGEDAAVEFMKDGRQYRLMRVDETTWVIHAAGVSAQDFQLILGKDGDRWSVSGRNGMVFPGSLGVTTSEVFRLFF